MLDYTASTILEKFLNQGTAQSVERVLKKLATKKATEILAVRFPTILGTTLCQRNAPPDPVTPSSFLYLHLGILCRFPVASVIS
jgi:hypothetical protein